MSYTVGPTLTTFAVARHGDAVCIVELDPWEGVRAPDDQIGGGNRPATAYLNAGHEMDGSLARLVARANTFETLADALWLANACLRSLNRTYGETDNPSRRVIEEALAVIKEVPE